MSKYLEALNDLEACYHEETIREALRIAHAITQEPSEEMVNKIIKRGGKDPYHRYNCLNDSDAIWIFQDMAEQLIKEASDE